MGRERDEQPSPDLFSADAARDTSLPPSKPPATEVGVEPPTQRHVLPKNLHNAVEHLNDEELNLLHAATLEEMKRRGTSPPSTGADSAQPHQSRNLVTKRPPPKNKMPHQRQANIAEVTLTIGQVNAVRAAFKAGITPTRIARQFGISQSNVRKALASDESKP